MDSVASWCRRHGVDERDENEPLKLVAGNGFRMLVAGEMPDQVLEDH